MTQIITNVIGDQTVAANRAMNPDNAALALVYWQQQKPIVPAELNLMQQASNENRRLLASNVGRPGFFTRDAFTNSGTSLVIPESWALVNGEVIHLASGLGTTGSPYSTVTVALSPPPGSGTAYDVVFLEVWYAEVSAIGMPDAASENLWASGWVNSGSDLAATSGYVIKDPLVTSVAETTRRVQLRWRIRVFNSVPAPVGDGLVASGAYTTGPGAMADSGVNNGGYPFATLAGTINSGLYRAGDGTLTAANVFKDTAGYSFAVPIAVITHTAGEGNLNVATQVADKRKSASPLGIISDENPNVGINGDDIIFRKHDGVTETGRVIGSSSPFRIQTTQFVSLATVGTAPLVVASTTKVTNLNAHYLDFGGTPTAPGNASGNIPVSNGTVNTNLNAALVAGKVPGSAPGNLVSLDIGGTYNGLINPSLLPSSAPLTTVANLSDSRAVIGNIYYGTGTSGVHPAADFLLKTEISLMGVSGSGINAAKNAEFATNASHATNADSANSVNVNGVLGAGNSIFYNVSSANIPSTVMFRDTGGNVAFGTATGNLNGTAHNSDTLSRTNQGNNAPEPLNFASGYTFMIAAAGTWSLGPGTGTAGWYYPSFSSVSGMFNPNLFKFPFEPSRFRVQNVATMPVRCKLRGFVFRAGVGGPASPATYGFRIVAPDSTVVFSTTFAMNNGGGAIPDGQQAYFDLGSVAPGYFNVNANGAQDGQWEIQISNTDSGPNAYGIGNIFLEAYVFGPNANGSY